MDNLRVSGDTVTLDVIQAYEKMENPLKNILDSRINQPTQTSTTINRENFIEFFTELAYQGNVKRLTLHLPEGVAYGIGTTSVQSGGYNVNVNMSKVTIFYTTVLVFLALVLGIVATLGVIKYITLFETIVMAVSLFAIISATVVEWKGWNNRGLR